MRLGAQLRYNNLAVLLKEQRRYPEAESLYRQAIEINKTPFGTDHPRVVAAAYNNLARLLNEEGALVLNGQDKFAEGESLIRQAIEITEKALGKEHYTIAFEYSTLALLLENEHKYAEAESRFRRAIEIGKKTLGEDHPDVATWYENLAGLLQIWGEYVETEALYLQAFEIFQAKFGPENPNTVRVKSKYDSLRRLNDKPLNSAR
jgi:tetratricopeptide (TPR) repeat protein